MAPREYPLTAAYAKFVNAGLIQHVGQGGKIADMPDGTKNATKDLTENQKGIIKRNLENQIDRILEEESAVLDMGPKYQGTSEDAKKFLQDVLELAEKANIDNAHAALEKVNSVSSAALKKEDMEAGDAAQSEVSESTAPVGGTPDVASPGEVAPLVTSPEEPAPRVTSPEEPAPGVTSPEVAAPRVTSPEEPAPGVVSPEVAAPRVTSPEEPAPGVVSPEGTARLVTSSEEPAPGVTSPEVAAPRVTSPEEPAPGVTSPGQQARSGIRRYQKGRRLQAGESVEEIEEENIPWAQSDPHDWPWATHRLKSGVAIMAEKTTERKDGHSNNISYYLIELPVKTEKNGVPVTLYQHKLVRYSDYPDAIDAWKQNAAKEGKERCVFAATDKEDPDTKIITRKRDGKSYKFLRLEFVASLTPLVKNRQAQSTLPAETECIIAAEGYDTPVFLSTSQFKRLVGDKKGKLLISRVCARDGQAIPARTEARRITYLNPACPDNTEELELLDSSRASTALPEGQQGQQGIDEDALFGRVQAYVDRRFTDFSTELSAAVASSIAKEMDKMTSALGSMIESQIQAQISEVRGSSENRETSPSATAGRRHDIAISDKLRDALQGSSGSSRERERTLPPYSSPSPPRSLPVRRSIEV